MKDWITCSNCEEEFKVITDSLEHIAYCPFCAEDITEDWSDFNEDEDE